MDNTLKKQWVYILSALLVVLSACSVGDAKGNEKTPKIEVVDENTGEETDEGVAVDKVTEPLYALNSATYAIEPIGDANAKVVLLTIDDAPDKWALDMAKTLKDLDAPAIFFVNGHFIETNE
jgi:peptidoglycan/xylan/chitin deacetylase (PgdA/CDA1 family)